MWWVLSVVSVAVVVDFPEEALLPKSFSFAGLDNQLDVVVVFVLVVVVVDFPCCPNLSTSLAWTSSWMWWWWWLWLLLAVESPSALALQLHHPRQLPRVVDHSGITALGDWA